MPLQPVIKNYLLMCQIEELPLPAIQIYDKALSEFLEYIGNIPISDFRPSHVDEYLATLKGGRHLQAKGVLVVFVHWLLAQNKLWYAPTRLRCSSVFPERSKAKRSWVV